MYVPKMFNLVMMYTTLTHDKNKGAVIQKRRVIPKQNRNIVTIFGKLTNQSKLSRNLKEILRK